jgi:hypothetical protein
MKRTIILFILILFTCITAQTQAIDLASILASSDGSVITLHWNTKDETNVSKYVVERRVGTNGQFIQIANLDPKGQSSYDYIDKTAFRSTATLYQYLIRIKFTNGNPDQEIGPVSVSHSVNSVKRTWGSIKAMFR